MWDLIKNIILFIGIIILLHYFYNFFLDNYASKNSKDLVETQTQKYKNILNEILETQPKKPISPHPLPDIDTEQPFIDDPEMENELISMVQSQL